MLGNRVSTALVVAALLAPALLVLAPPAGAQEPQTTEGPDPYVKDIFLSGTPIAGKDVTVTVRIANRGTLAYSPNTPFRVCLIWNESVDGDDCSAHVMNVRYPLNQHEQTDLQRNQASSATSTNVRPGGFVDVPVRWRPHEFNPAVHPQGGAGQIIVRFSETDPFVVDAKPEPLARFSVVVRRPDLDLKAAYDNLLPDRITASCEAPPNVNGRSCIALPGQYIPFHVTVQNRGNFADTFSLWHEGNASIDADKQIWNVTFSPKNPFLQPGETATVLMTLQSARTGTTVDAGDRVNENLNIKVWAASLSNTVKREAIDFPVLTIGQLYKINMTTWQPVRVGNLSKEIRFGYSVGNEGNGADRVNVEFVPQRSTINATNWALRIDPTFPVHARSNVSKAFSITPPDNVTAGRYSIFLRAFSVDDRKGVAVAEFNFTAVVLQKYALTSAIDFTRAFLPPAEPAVYTLKIKNIGNGPDRLDLNMTTSGPAGWTAKIEPEILTILADEERQVKLTVVSPPGERERRGYHANVTAVSTGPFDDRGNPLTRSARANVTFKTYTETIRGPNFEVTPLQQTTGAFIDPNGTRTYTLRVRNVGNVFDNVSFEPSAPLGWTVDVSPKRVFLFPPQIFGGSAERTITVAITAPRAANVGDQVTLLVRGKSEVDEALRREVNFGLRVSGPDYAVGAVAVDRVPVYADQGATVSVVVANQGNKPGDVDPTLRVVYTYAGTERVLLEEAITGLAASSSRTLTIPWNTSNLAGQGTFTALIDAKGEVKEIEESNNERTLGGDAGFVRVFDLRIVPPVGLVGRPGERVMYQEPPNAVVLQNFGNRPEPVEVTIQSRNGWGGVTRTLNLNPNEEAVVGFDVAIPASPSASEDVAQVTVTPGLRRSHVLRASLTTRVTDTDAPVLESVKVTPAQAVLNAPMEVSAVVTDALGLSSVTAYVLTPQNDTETIPLAPTGRKNVWSARQAWTITGDYRLYVEAVDGSAAANRADTRARAVAFSVVPGSAPKIEAATDLRNPLRSGTPIDFRITDPLGVARVWYVVGNQEYALPLTGRLDTTNLSAGEVRFTVWAENLYRVKSSLPVTVTVDNTPPTESRVTLDPARPKAGESVAVRIAVDPTVEVVEVIVKRDGQILETKTAQKQSQGVFILRYTPGEGKYEFDVLAKDVAGNPKLQEGAVKFSTTGILGSPPAGLLAGLAALAAVALVARRRR